MSHMIWSPTGSVSPSTSQPGPVPRGERAEEWNEGSGREQKTSGALMSLLFSSLLLSSLSAAGFSAL